MLAPGIWRSRVRIDRAYARSGARPGASAFAWAMMFFMCRTQQGRRFASAITALHASGEGSGCACLGNVECGGCRCLSKNRCTISPRHVAADMRNSLSKSACGSEDGQKAFTVCTLSEAAWPATTALQSSPQCRSTASTIEPKPSLCFVIRLLVALHTSMSGSRPSG